MNILLDENITGLAKPVLEMYGHKVSLVIDILKAGTSDEDVFKYAQKNNQVLITQNGKDFIVLIPPQADGVKHYGLFWVRTQVTKKNCECIMNAIGQYIRENEGNIPDTYYTVKKSEIGEIVINLRYPKVQKKYSLWMDKM